MTLPEPFVIPRTERLPTDHSAKNKADSEEFIKELREKLENVRRARQLPHQLNINDPTDNISRLPPIPSRNPTNFHGQLDLRLADLKRFQLEEDNDQSILDQHVSRVWNDLTPHLSPGTISPCPAVPNRRRTHDSITAGGDGRLLHDFHSIRSTNFLFA